MKQRPRIYYTEAQKALMWDRWKAWSIQPNVKQLPQDESYSGIAADSFSAFI